MTGDRRQTTDDKKKKKSAAADYIRPPSSVLRVLKQRAEFLAVAQHGKKWVTPGFILQFHATPPAAKAALRYGLTASGKVGNAVMRNRSRRRLRALAHEVLPLHAAPGHDYVLIARTTTATREYEDLKKDFLWALKKLGAKRDS